jgi:hypothetical protein
VLLKDFLWCHRRSFDAERARERGDFKSAVSTSAWSAASNGARGARAIVTSTSGAPSALFEEQV